jgi:magnesium-transporting ATPase (P-type)
MPFNSSRKRMSIIIEYKKADGSLGRRLLIKGASEIVRKSLTHFHDFLGRIVPIDDELTRNIDTAISTMASKALRTLCIAYKELNGSEDIEK